MKRFWPSQLSLKTFRFSHLILMLLFFLMFSTLNWSRYWVIRTSQVTGTVTKATDDVICRRLDVYIPPGPQLELFDVGSNGVDCFARRIDRAPTKIVSWRTLLDLEVEWVDESPPWRRRQRRKVHAGGVPWKTKRRWNESSGTSWQPTVGDGYSFVDAKLAVAKFDVADVAIHRTAIPIACIDRTDNTTSTF